MSVSQGQDTAPERLPDTSDRHAALLAKLDDPAVQTSLQTLLDHADLLALLVSGMDELVGRSDIIADSLISSVHELRGNAKEIESGVDLGAIADAAKSLAGKAPQLAAHLTHALDNGILDDAVASAKVAASALPEVDKLARGLVAGSNRFAQQPVEVKGPVSLLRLIKDPDINRALSYLATVAQSIGRELAQPTTPAVRSS